MGESDMNYLEAPVPMHDFQSQLAWSEEMGCEPFWDAVYRKAFPNLVNHMPCPGDVDSQRQGVDRLLFLSNNLTLRIDEKKRRVDYGDVLLEYVSVSTTGAPGWIEKDLAIDYLAYAVIPKMRCRLYPFQMLRRAWLKYKCDWIAKYRKIVARNAGYETISVAVPANVVNAAVSQASLIDVSHELGINFLVTSK